MSKRFYKNAEKIEKHNANISDWFENCVLRLKIALYTFENDTFEYYSKYIVTLVIWTILSFIFVICLIKFFCVLGGGTVNDFLPL